LRRNKVELASVIHQAVETARPLADSANHDLRIELPAEPVYLDADPVRLAQVFGNLLNNSCKYTKPGGTIRLTAEPLDGNVVVKIKDTGAGIPRDKLKRIFDMFTQVDRTSERSQGGLGIGLTLVKRLVEMHGGSVEARSEGEGKGSEFEVRLPIMSENAEAMTGAPIATSPVSGSAAATSRISARRATQPRSILIVDDNRDSAESLALLLEFDGNQTHMAHDGFEALEAIERHRPEVLLLDIGLPKLNGHDVCRHVREQSWGKDIIVIALTGWGQEEDRRKSRQAGFNGHLVKPVDYDELLELLGSLPNGRE
jgi:CheY-like chemotaxis protein